MEKLLFFNLFIHMHLVHIFVAGFKQSIFKICHGVTFSSVILHTNSKYSSSGYVWNCIYFSELSRATLVHLSENNHLAGKKCILVGAKSDLVRSRLVSPADGCHVAMTRGVKFSEISAGVGDNVDTLLVGIVLQCRYDFCIQGSIQ